MDTECSGRQCECHLWMDPSQRSYPCDRSNTMRLFWSLLPRAPTRPEGLSCSGCRWEVDRN